jgi:predicted O-methyltransferase YrrM
MAHNGGNGGSRDMGFYRVLSSRLRKYSRLMDARLEKMRLQEAGLSHADSIVTDTDKAELLALYALASSCPPGAAALEIGSYLGASACYLAAGLAKGGGHLYCVDTWQNETMIEGHRDTYAEFLANTRNFGHLLTPVRKKSTELGAGDIRTPLHLVFLDGDHSYEAVKNDFALVRQWIAKDGVVAFHDFGDVYFEGVSRVVGEALASGEWVMAGFEHCLAWIKPASWVQPPWLMESEASARKHRVHRDF